MKGYWIVLKGEIIDQSAQDEYNRLWAPIADQFQARVNALAVPPLTKEARYGTRVIVVEFPSYEMAKECYESPAYQPARDLATKASDRSLFIFEGLLA